MFRCFWFFLILLSIVNDTARVACLPRARPFSLSPHYFKVPATQSTARESSIGH